MTRENRNPNYYPSTVLKDLASLNGLGLIDLLDAAQALTKKYGADQLILLGAATLGDHLKAAPVKDRNDWLDRAPEHGKPLAIVVRTMLLGAAPGVAMAYIKSLSPRESAETILALATCFSHPNMAVQLPSEETLAQLDDDVDRRADAFDALSQTETEEETPEAS